MSHQGEGVGDLAVWGQLGPKAIGRKELVAVVVLDDLSHRFERHGVHVHLVGVHIVQGGGLRWVT